MSNGITLRQDTLLQINGWGEVEEEDDDKALSA